MHAEGSGITCITHHGITIVVGKPRPKDLVHTRNHQNCFCCEGFFCVFGIFFTRCWVFPKELVAPSKPYDSGLTFSTFVVGTHGKTRQMRTKNQGAEGSEPVISWWPNLGVPFQEVLLHWKVPWVCWVARSGTFCSWLSWCGTTRGFFDQGQQRLEKSRCGAILFDEKCLWWKFTL